MSRNKLYGSLEARNLRVFLCHRWNQRNEVDKQKFQNLEHTIIHRNLATCDWKLFDLESLEYISIILLPSFDYISFKFFSNVLICGKYKHIFLALPPGRCWTEDIFFSGYWRCPGQAWYLALSISTRNATWGDEFPSGLKISILFWVFAEAVGLLDVRFWYGHRQKRKKWEVRGCLLQRKCVRFTFLALHGMVHHTHNMQYY